MVNPDAERPDRGERDELREVAFLTFVRGTSVFAVVMTVAELFARGVTAWHPYAFALMAVVFFAIARDLVRAPGRRFLTHVVVGIYALLFLAIDVFTPGDDVAIRVATYAFPVAVVFLAGSRAAWVVFALAVVQFVASRDLLGASDADRAHMSIQIVGASVVSALMIILTTAFDRARRRATALARARERDLRDALARTEAAAEARSRFLANTSHEIRTPMNGVLGLSRLLADELIEPAQRELAETVVSSGESLLHILDDILDLSKLDADALLLDEQPAQPAVVAKQVVALMSAGAKERGVGLELEASPDLPAWVRIDDHRVRQVLTNLVENALKFTSRGGVVVRVDHREGHLVIDVVDTGIGIEEAQQQVLFSPFVQADSGTARRFGGTGLGLAISKQLCELMGGALSVRSRVGEGSTFTLRIPAPVVDAPTTSRVADSPAAGPKLSVLVAEDNHVNQLVIRLLLERLSADVHIVADGEQAVAAVQEQAFDVVLMDWHMPGVDGLEATRRIRELEGPASRTPVIALTASVMAHDRETCLAAGMNDVLPKPIEWELLEAKLEAYAGRRARA